MDQSPFLKAGETFPSVPIEVSFEEFTLDNGLHVILHEHHALPIVAINLWYHVGSKDETQGKTGFAHLFEHMMFQGSAHVGPNQHFHFVQEAGGSLNASTSFDRTNYFETLPAHRLELGLWLEADRMMSLALNEETLETQRNVVMEERRSRYDNQPYGTMYEELFRRAFTRQPYQWSVIGSMEDIGGATLEDVRDFHARYYQPCNASLCLSGDFDRNDAERLIRRYFEDLPNTGERILRPVHIEPPQREQRRDVIQDNVPLPAVIVGMHVPEALHPDTTALEVLTYILSSGDSSRLHQRLVYRDRVAQSFMTYALSLELSGLFLFRATAQKDKSPESVEEGFWRELAEVRVNGITEPELLKARNLMEASFVQELSTMGSRADILNTYHVQYRDTARIRQELDLIRSVSVEDVARVANSYLYESNATVLYYLPRNGARENGGTS